MEPLWAKSGRKKTLVDHTNDVVTAFESLFGAVDAPTRLGICWQRFFKLKDYPHFWNASLAAALFHDLGKANDGFQNAVLRNGEQRIRHEHLSALLMGSKTVHQWVSTRPDIDWDVVLAAVLTHHLKVSFNSFSEFYFARTSANGSLIEVFQNHPDFTRLMKTIADRLQLQGELPSIDRFWSFRTADCVRSTSKLVGSTPKTSNDVDCFGPSAPPSSPQTVSVPRCLESIIRSKTGLTTPSPGCPSALRIISRRRFLIGVSVSFVRRKNGRMITG
jgi:CRISPR-associated endonuclease Cas3-HD